MRQAKSLSPQSFTNWTGTPQDQIDAKLKAAQNMPGSYSYTGPADYEMPPMPDAPSTNIQDYYPGGPGSPQTTPQGPSAQQPQGSGYANPAAVRDAVKSGAISQDQARQILKSKFGFE